MSKSATTPAPKPMAPEKRARYLARWKATLAGLHVQQNDLRDELVTATSSQEVDDLLPALFAVHAEILSAHVAIARYSS